jgi:hypothetical protein
MQCFQVVQTLGRAGGQPGRLITTNGMTWRLIVTTVTTWMTNRD